MNEQPRIAVVTGANRGLGLATARRLAELGYQVVLTGRAPDAIEGAAAGLRDEGLDGVTGRVMDVSSDDSVGAFFDWLVDAHGRIDVLVNNAGVVLETQRGSGSADTLEVASATVREAFDTNALGAYRTLQRALPLMNAAGYGRVVNVTSGMGALSEMGGGHPAYRISKTALHAVTVVFAHEAAEGVKINAVCPGWVRTEMGGASATRTLDEGIAGIVWAATLPDDGPSGGLFRDGEPLTW